MATLLILAFAVLTWMAAMVSETQASSDVKFDTSVALMVVAVPVGTVELVTAWW